MHSHSRRQLILESGCSHQVAVFPLCQCPLFLHLFLLLQLCMASRQTGQTFFDLFFDFKQACTISCWMFWFPYLSSVKLFRPNKKMHACWLASARFLPAQFTILFGDLKVCYTIVFFNQKTNDLTKSTIEFHYWSSVVPHVALVKMKIFESWIFVCVTS